MYATKQPSLRINQADLKCKSGCGFFGNADWEGYCSKCYRNYMEKERQKKSQSPQVPGFSKFEEKKRLQDKKNNFKNIFRKTSSAKESIKVPHHHEVHHSNPEQEKLRAEYLVNFSSLGQTIQKDFYKCVNLFYLKVKNEIFTKPIDEVAELVQRYYNNFNNRINSSEIYKSVAHEVRDQLIDFFEKFMMTVLYDHLFCPQSTNDEEKDLVIQDRIRKLNWVNAHHLDCCISETSVEVRDLVYGAITELLGMDSMKAPQEKLSCVVRCCSSVMMVLKHCQGAPVSADEFLPALIFVVLKANPARLKSNILFVTRFCNDKRLMQGEGGYYFTNLCCAVSFIENLTAQALNMSEEEFQGYMTGAITSVSAWESALVACEGMHQLYEHLALLKGLADRTDIVQQGTRELRENIEKFKAEISTKVLDVLEKTPLIIKPRKLLIELDRSVDQQELEGQEQNPPITVTVDATSEDSNSSHFYQHNLQNVPINIGDNKKSKLQLDISKPCLPSPNSSDFDHPNSQNLSGAVQELTANDDSRGFMPKEISVTSKDSTTIQKFSNEFTKISNEFSNPSNEFSNPSSEFSNKYSSNQFSNSSNQFSTSSNQFSNSSNQFSNSSNQFSNSSKQFSNSSKEFSNPPNEFSNPSNEFPNPSTNTSHSQNEFRLNSKYLAASQGTSTPVNKSLSPQHPSKEAPSPKIDPWSPQRSYLLPKPDDFDSQSLDGLTPEDSTFLGLSNVNYDIDFSDFSGDNSIADELTPERRKSPSFTPDPFSPVGSSCYISQSPLVPSSAPLTKKDPQPQEGLKPEFVLSFLDNSEQPQVEPSNSLLDQKEDTPTTQLPPPLKPVSQYSGFSKQGFQIPSIPCSTGDFSSLTLSQTVFDPNLPGTSRENVFEK